MSVCRINLIVVLAVVVLVSACTNAANEQPNASEKSPDMAKFVGSPRPAKVESRSAKRIVLSASRPITNIDLKLASRTSESFVVAAANGQTIEVEVVPKDIAIKIEDAPKNAQVVEDLGYLRATFSDLGELIFSVRNTGNEEISGTLKVRAANVAR